MVGIDAPAVIAAVANLLPRRNVAPRGEPCEPMRAHAILTAEREHAIPASANIAGIRPAGFRISSLDIRPEPCKHLSPPVGVLPQLGVLPSVTASGSECYVNFGGHGFALCQSRLFAFFQLQQYPIRQLEVATRIPPGYLCVPQSVPQVAIRVGAFRSRAGRHGPHRSPAIQRFHTALACVCRGMPRAVPRPDSSCRVT
jgi:hypothetical protein